MRSTRSKNGKLPAKIVPFGEPILEGDIVDAAIDKIEEEIANDMAEVESATEVEEVVDVAMAAEAVITTINAKQPVQDGVYIVRCVGKGKLELVSIQHAQTETMGSIEFGNIIQSNADRKALVESVHENLPKITANIVQAIDSANKNIFRFLNLTLELRFMIYDEVIKSDHMLTYNHSGTRCQTMGFSLRGVNKQIRDETAKFFWSNNFKFHDFPKLDPQVKQTFDLVSASLTEVTFQWFVQLRKDKLTLEAISKCPNLKIFNLVITKFSIKDSYDHFYQRRWFFDQRDRAPKFTRTRGIEDILKLRGLTKVNVKKFINILGRPEPGQILQSELNEFQAMLNEYMTQPKVAPSPLTSASAAKPKPKRNRKSRGKTDRWDLGSDDDADYKGPSRRRRKC
ncbi:hypothetical protein HYFRA_00009887 [Hymenoscyphus fraxineus]|uniref:Uncharacterized protein n=1 Tax=Hymenoscyphus fraxineus TaxID=746836 RepID=A0A9N9L1P3_9HELO|nr:hypothetical protein HYFRA_00009887 [Hymenoscyphus fraxineus]